MDKPPETSTWSREPKKSRSASFAHWIFRNWLPVLLGTVLLGMFVFVGGALISPIVMASYNADAALQRARAMPPAEREKILRACVEIARQMREDEFERRFEDSPATKPVPGDFAALQPWRVHVTKEDATILLAKISLDSGIVIVLNGLDTPTPSAELVPGTDPVVHEPWATLENAE